MRDIEQEISKLIGELVIDAPDCHVLSMECVTSSALTRL